MKKNILLASAFSGAALVGYAQTEPIKFGDFENWVTRDITESVVIGGKHRTVYEVGPKILRTRTLEAHLGPPAMYMQRCPE